RPEAIVDAVRSIVRDVDPLLAAFEVKTMDRVLADSMALFRLVLWLFAGFAALAVGLAMTGTYGVISYAAAARAREFALRLALGATPRRVAAAVLRHGLRLTAGGLACGIAAGFAAAPLLDNLPVTVRPPSLLMMAPVMIVVAAVSLAACVLPALRAARVDLMSVLRNE
ncbi:MAG TPA: FtsX-like permease family protein, partial [Vicinamibacterales bacterium]|nr:FtsX-like permease family protein [Vicinamibacterales bacterium]